MTEVNQTGLAELLGLTTRQIRNLEREGMPHRADGAKKLYPIPGALSWYYKRQFVAEQPTSLEEAKLRKLSAEAEIVELELGEKRGQLLSIDFVRKDWERLLYAFRSRLLNAPSRWAADLVGLDTVEAVEAKLEAMIEDAMGALSEDATGYADDGDDDSPGGG